MQETKEQILERVKNKVAERSGKQWSYIVLHDYEGNYIDEIAEAYHAEMLKQIALSDEEIKGIVINHYQKQEAYLKVQVPTAEFWLRWMRDQFIKGR